MNCSHCGREVAQYANYCSFCGSRMLPAAPHRRLTRSAIDSKIAGVCGGLAEYLGVDPTMVRLAWAVFSVVPGGIAGGLIAYVAAWIIVPKARVQVAAPQGVSTATPTAV